MVVRIDLPWRSATGRAGNRARMKKIRTLIIDDEPLAREGLAVLLAR